MAQFGSSDSSIATLDAAAIVGGVSVAAGSHVTVQLENTLTVLGEFKAAGGTVELSQGGTIAGGTVDLTGAVIVGGGGVIDGSVLVGDLGRGITVTSATLAATDQARQGAALSVVGTLGLTGGTYDGLVLSLDGFGTTNAAELDVTNGDLVVLGAAMRVVLSQDDPQHGPGSNPAGANPVLGGLGTMENQGLIVSDALYATIDASAFTNLGSIALNDATIAGETEYFSSGLLSWTATLAPTLTLAATQFENDGTISGAGATVDVSGGSFVNTGVIDLGQATAQGPLPLPQPHIGDLQLLSTLDIGANVAAFSNTGTLSATTIDLDGSVSLGALGTLLGTVVFGGTLDLGGGTLDAGTLDPATSYIFKGTILNGTILDSNGQINIAAATLDQVAVLYSQPTTLSDFTGPGTVVLSASTTELAYTTTAPVHGVTVNAGASGVQDSIAILAGSLTFGADTRISDTVAGSSLAIGGGVFVENGSIALDASGLNVATLDGSGTITLGDGAELTIGSIAPGSAVTIAFGSGVNSVTLPGNLSGTGSLGLSVTGLAAGDLLDFTAVSADPGTVFAQPGAGLDAGLLQVQGASGDQASVTTNATGLTFSAGADLNGGTIVTVACFRHGTRIATPDGERPVEQLQIGDLVLTHQGPARPIKWLGRRAYAKQLIERQPQLRAVRVAEGALGDGLPRRPLHISPMHAMLVDGVLVPIAALVNGRTITRAPIADTAYVHIELDKAELVLAEGAASESYVDCDNRAMFANAGEFQRLYPDHRPQRWAFPVSRLEEGWQLEAIRQRLAGPAASLVPGGMLGNIEILAPGRIEGWAIDVGDPAEPVTFEIVVGGRQLGCLVANRYRIDLDRAGKGRGACGFTAELPGLDPAALASLALVRLSDGLHLIG